MCHSADIRWGYSGRGRRSSNVWGVQNRLLCKKCKSQKNVSVSLFVMLNIVQFLQFLE